MLQYVIYVISANAWVKLLGYGYCVPYKSMIIYLNCTPLNNALRRKATMSYALAYIAMIAVGIALGVMISMKLRR